MVQDILHAKHHVLRQLFALTAVMTAKEVISDRSRILWIHMTDQIDALDGDDA